MAFKCLKINKTLWTNCPFAWKLARRWIVYWGTPILKNMRVKFSKKGKASPQNHPFWRARFPRLQQMCQIMQQNLCLSKFRTYDKERWGCLLFHNSRTGRREQLITPTAPQRRTCNRSYRWLQWSDSEFLVPLSSSTCSFYRYGLYFRFLRAVSVESTFSASPTRQTEHYDMSCPKQLANYIW